MHSGIGRPSQKTRIFRDLGHDADLVPMVTRQLRFLMEGFHRDTNVTYDIQGMSDEGSDVLLRLQSAHNSRFIGIQIKSHKELGDKELIKNLRNQLSRSEDRYDPLLRNGSATLAIGSSPLACAFPLYWHR